MVPHAAPSEAGTKSLSEESITSKSGGSSLASIRAALTDIGLVHEGVERLSLETIQKLIPVLERGDKHGALVIKMFNAVNQSNPGRLTEMVDILSTYGGSFSILGQFLERVGHLDPFIATSRAQLHILPAEALPSTRGASGHILHGLTYCAYDSDSPTDTVGYFSKKQAITRIFEAFNRERMSSDSLHQVRQRRTLKLRDALQDLTLNDLEQNADLAKQTGSHLIVRNMEVYSELRKAIADCKAHLTDLMYGGSVILSGIKSIKVSEDPGRQFYGWFEEHFKENPNAPRGIRLAFASLRDPDVSLSPEDEGNYLRGLLSYQRLHSYINKDVALGGLVKDLKEYESLSRHDPFRLDEAVDHARQQLQQRAADGSAELSIAEFGKMLELSGMVQFRQAMNQRVLSQYGEEFATALRHFEFVTFKDGKWREDALGDSVPMERLKQHLYGARIGVAEPDMHESKKQGLLTQRDFKHISQAHFLDRLVRDPEKMLNTMPITDFREMVQGVIVAYRKALHLDACLASYLVTPAGAALTINREQIGDALTAWKPTLLIGGKYLPIEARHHDPETATGEALPVSELARRVMDRRVDLLSVRSPLWDEYSKQKHVIEQAAPAGLYLEEMESFWSGIEKKVAVLVPAATKDDIVTRAVQLVANPVVISAGFDTKKTLAARYLFPEEVAKIENFLTVEDSINTLSRDWRPNLGELGEKLRRSLYQNIYSGGIIASGYRRLTLHSEPFSSFAERVSVKNPGFGEIVSYDPQKLQEAFSRLERDYIPVNELGGDWVERAKRICSKEGRAERSRHELGAVDDVAFRAARALRSNSSDYVSREFADAINLVAGISRPAGE